MASGLTRARVSIGFAALTIAALSLAAVALRAASASTIHRPPYRVRVERELQVMSKRMDALSKRPVRRDLRPRIAQGLETLRGKYETARLAFRQWSLASDSQKPARRKAVDAALVDMRKFYTKVLNRFHG